MLFTFTPNAPTHSVHVVSYFCSLLSLLMFLMLLLPVFFVFAPNAHVVPRVLSVFIFAPSAPTFGAPIALCFHFWCYSLLLPMFLLFFALALGAPITLYSRYWCSSFLFLLLLVLLLLVLLLLVFLTLIPSTPTHVALHFHS